MLLPSRSPRLTALPFLRCPCLTQLWAGSSTTAPHPSLAAADPLPGLLLQLSLDVLPPLATAPLVGRARRFHSALPDPTPLLRVARSPNKVALPEAPRQLHQHRPLSTTPPSRSYENETVEGGTLARWESLLRASTPFSIDSAGGHTASYDAADLRGLFSAAVSHSPGPGGRQQKAGGVLPQRALALFVRAYSELVLPSQRPAFFRLLAEELGVQRANVDAAVASWGSLAARTAEGGEGSVAAALRGAKLLREACQPTYALLFRRVGQQSEGIHFLVQMRAHLMDVIASDPATAAPLRAMSDSLRDLLGDWFSVGIMHLERISWEHSSAAMLEKVVAGEAVHSIRGWRDLRRRLGPTKRLFAFFHPSMPQEPLVLLHTSVRNSIATRMTNVLLPSAESSAGGEHRGKAAVREPTTAVFYSISNTQPGLKGVELGTFLIKQAAQHLLREFPSIHTLVTLSPIPGFRKWLEEQMHRELHDHAMGEPSGEDRLWMRRPPLLLPSEVEHCLEGLTEHTPVPEMEAGVKRHTAAVTLIRNVLREEHWRSNSQMSDLLRPLLLRLCARYLLTERRRQSALDPVANFHLRNGAWLWQVNWEGDTSTKGMARSYGLMVNYRYILEDVERNNRQYVDRGVIAASEEVLKLGSAGD